MLLLNTKVAQRTIKSGNLRPKNIIKLINKALFAGCLFLCPKIKKEVARCQIVYLRTRIYYTLGERRITEYMGYDSFGLKIGIEGEKEF